MPWRTFKWFMTGLLDDLPSQKDRDILANLLEEEANRMIDEAKEILRITHKKRVLEMPDTFTGLIRKYKENL
jgi:hypothetical protein